MKKKVPESKMKKTKQAATQFTIDLDFKGLFILIMLALLTAIVIFYLGVIFGKASRNPIMPPVASSEKAAPAKASDDKITVNDLEIYNIRSEGDQLATLKGDTKSVLAEADRVLNGAGDNSEEDVASEPEPTVTPAAELPQTKQWPDSATASPPEQDTYSVQVFATKDKDKADRIVRLLRQQRFEAYLTEAAIENQTIYRVRVGKKSKMEIEKLNTDLGKVIGGMGMKSTIIKIN